MTADKRAEAVVLPVGRDAEGPSTNLRAASVRQRTNRCVTIRFHESFVALLGSLLEGLMHAKRIYEKTDTK